MQSSNRLDNEDRLRLALHAYKTGQIKTLREAATTYEVKLTTLHDRNHGRQSRRDCRLKTLKLTLTEESVLVQRILDLDAQGFPARLSVVRETADLLLASRGIDPAPTVGVNWPSTFVKRCPKLRTVYTRKYDYQRKQCEDRKLIQDWFDLVQNTIAKYGIVEDDIYNFDETGFQMGVISTAKVVTGTEKRQGRAKVVQPGNREWVTVTNSISATGWALPALVIFKAKQHQESWYKIAAGAGIPRTWAIRTSEKGWTDDEIGFEWIQHFHNATATHTKGQYRLLIMDGHGSHHTARFEDFCKQNNIITLCMPPHSSHLLQPLDVVCFSLLKRAYGTRVESEARLGINHITKTEFLPLYYAAHVQAMTEKNVKASFAAAGLVPYDPERVLTKLPQRTPTPPVVVRSPPTLVSKTPHTTADLQQQVKMIKRRRSRRTTVSSSDSAFERLIKGCETAMQNAAILKAENAALRAANGRKKRQQATKRKAIAKDGILTIDEGLQMLENLQSQQQAQVEAQVNRTEPEAPVRKKRAAPKCSLCESLEHNARTCPRRKD